MRKIAALLSIILIILLGCNVTSSISLSGNKRVVDVNMTNFSHFDTIEVQESLNLNVSYGSEAAISVEADEKLINYIGLEQVGTTIRFFFQRDTGYRDEYDVNINITLPDVKGLKFSGSSISTSSSLVSGFNLDHNITVFMENYQNLTLDINATEIILDEIKYSSLELSGRTNSLVGSMSYSGNLNFKDFSCGSADINNTGNGLQLNGALSVDNNMSLRLNGSYSSAGELEINASYLDIYASGQARLGLKGNVSSLFCEIYNSSKIELDGFNASTGALVIENNSEINGTAVFSTNLTANLLTNAKLELNGTGNGGLYLTADNSSHGMLKDFSVTQATVSLNNASNASINTTGIINYTLRNASALYYTSSASGFSGSLDITSKLETLE